MAFTITNFLDDVALYQNITRLPGETNEEFATRIKDFSKIKFGTDYLTQIQSVMSQTGLKKYQMIEFTCTDPYEISISEEYIVFRSFFENGSTNNYFRVYISNHDVWRENLFAIDTSNINVTINNISSSQHPVNFGGNFLLRNSNTELVYNIINNKRSRLLNGNLIPGSFISREQYHCRNRVYSVPDIRKEGDYFLDETVGYLELFNDPSNSFHVEYKTYSKIFIFYRTELSLQSMESTIKYGLNDNFIDLLPQILYNRSIGE